MATYHQVVHDIRAFLRAADLTRLEQLQQLATQYAEACESVNGRLEVCEDLLQRGLRKEAVVLAQVEPALLDLYTVLDFPERATWEQLTGTFKAARPPKLREAAADDLRQAFAAERKLGVDPQALVARQPFLSPVASSQTRSSEPMVFPFKAGDPMRSVETPKRRRAWFFALGFLAGIVMTAAALVAVQFALERARGETRSRETQALEEDLETERKTTKRLREEKNNLQDLRDTLSERLKQAESQIENARAESATAAKRSEEDRLVRARAVAELEQVLRKLKDADEMISVFKEHEALLKDGIGMVRDRFGSKTSQAMAIELFLKQMNAATLKELQSSLKDFGSALREREDAAMRAASDRKIDEQAEKVAYHVLEYNAAREVPAFTAAEIDAKAKVMNQHKLFAGRNLEVYEPLVLQFMNDFRDTVTAAVHQQRRARLKRDVESLK